MIKPILFNSEMVKAILDGRKTVTRRPIKPGPLAHCFLGSEDEGHTFDFLCGECRDGVFVDWVISVVAPFVPGDVLWVRESWAEMPYGVVYRADDEEPEGWDADDRWNPSIHMKKSSARLFLQVKSINVEHLNDITEEGALSEGAPNEWPMSPIYCSFCKGEGFVDAVHPVSLGHMEIECPYCAEATVRFSNLWNSTVKPADLPTYGWDSNPWVWVIEFEKCDRPEGFL